MVGRVDGRFSAVRVDGGVVVAIDGGVAVVKGVVGGTTAVSVTILCFGSRAAGTGIGAQATKKTGTQVKKRSLSSMKVVYGSGMLALDD
jgi:hypothetical protein